VLEGVVFLAVLRSPTPRNLALGLAASTLVAFVALTTMHERYAYPAIVFLALLLPDRRVAWLWAGLSVAFTANLLAAAPPTPSIGSVVPIDGPLGVAGSLGVTLLMAATMWLLLQRDDRGASPAPPPPI
jgi:hypothetical protein